MASSFTLEDIRRLEKTIGIRERVLDHLTAKELPTGARDVEVLTSLADSIDRSIFTRAKISIDEASNKAAEGTKEVLRELLLNLHTSSGIPQSPPTDTPQREVPEFQPTGMTINDGEMIKKHDNTDVSQFLEQRKEE